MIRYLFVPETRPGRGSGHLVRCLELARQLPDAAFLIPNSRQHDLRNRYPLLGDFRLFDHLPEFLPLPGGELPLVVFDLMRLEESDVRPVLSRALPVAIDSRGPGLRFVPFVLDLLPRLGAGPAWSAGNRHAPEFLPQPVKRRQPLAGPLPPKALVLVSFGGEDAAGLGGRLVSSGLLARCLPQAEVHFLAGPMSRSALPVLPSGWKHLPAVPVLREELHRYDLVVTSFGLTAHEARSAGTRVVLFNPRSYHEKLAAKAGFASMGVLKPNETRFRQVIKGTSAGKAPSGDAGPGLEGLAGLMSSWPKTAPCACPGCRATAQPVIARFADRTYFRCGQCGLEFLMSFQPAGMNYDDSYFFTDYQKQYGKTYLDDFGHIKAMGGERLDCLAAVDGNLSGLRLLDVGCAYGPFLAAARERGMAVCGTDISPSAVAHVRDRLGLPAVAGDIRRLGVADLGGPFDVVSLWYVIEHFPDLHLVLGRLNGLLETGGILALSTPSGQGISARRNHRLFLERSPADHYSIWMPSKARRLLRRYGFELLRIRVTGHHPERFPGWLGAAWLRGLSGFCSRLFGLGDTFELYARKTRGGITSGETTKP